MKLNKMLIFCSSGARIVLAALWDLVPMPMRNSIQFISAFRSAVKYLNSLLPQSPVSEMNNVK